MAKKKRFLCKLTLELRELERSFLLQKLHASAFNMSEMARRYGSDRASLHRRFAQYGIRTDNQRRQAWLKLSINRNASPRIF